MKPFVFALATMLALTPVHALSPEEARRLPPPATAPVDFVRDIQPLFESACVKCHAKGKEKGGFSLETREALLRGGDTGAGAVVGKSAESLIVESVSGLDEDLIMPKKGSRWTAAQVGLLRAWIDQGAVWPAGVTFAKPPPANLHPHAVPLVARPSVHPIDNLLANYFAAHALDFPAPVDDRTFARRAWLDLIGLLPTPQETDDFLRDTAADKRPRLIRRLLQDRRNYAEHWLTFWNDLLRNDYKGAGFIDGGRKQISDWLYQSLVANKPYDRFVAELVSPTPEREGFSRGIVWRGNVNASMLPPMQAAQSVSQVFLGVNLKCASCHDSFVSDWSLADAYGMAAVYADGPLELIHCDKPTGKKAAIRFLYPEIGALDPALPRAARLERFAALLTAPANGRLPRTLVNRLWSRLLGRGLVEPLDDMEKPAWSTPLLDWLAEDFVAHGYDVQHTLEVICTSAAYQLPAAETPDEKEAFVFRGPLTRRLSAEQFSDAVSAITGEWARLPSSLEFDFCKAGVIPRAALPQWIWTSEPAAAEGTPEAARHKVVFRKKFTLAAVPTDAYAAVLASQRFDVTVNGSVAKSVMRDGARNGRIALFDLRKFLRAGENIIALEISSLTEKAMNDEERARFPKSADHLNPRSGVAFYLHASLPGGRDFQLGSDDTWRALRRPAGAWTTAAFNDADWPTAQQLAPDATPIDEGPSLDPVNRADFANIPVDLGPQLGAAVSTAAQPGKIRAGLLAGDPLQVALDRPNREVVVPVRANLATTIQALELTNGATLNDRLQRAAARLAALPDAAGELPRLFRHALGRDPSAEECDAIAQLAGGSPKAADIADFLWALVNHPEFQLIN